MCCVVGASETRKMVGAYSARRRVVTGEDGRPAVTCTWCGWYTDGRGPASSVSAASVRFGFKTGWHVGGLVQGDSPHNLPEQIRWASYCGGSPISEARLQGNLRSGATRRYCPTTNVLPWKESSAKSLLPKRNAG